jgi:hypothetical protein
VTPSHTSTSGSTPDSRSKIIQPRVRGAKTDELHLTPLELIERIAALVPPPRTHRHRYFGVLAPNSPLRCAVTAMAQGAATQPTEVRAEPAQPVPVPPKRPAHYLWAVLIARIYEVFPLLCPNCGGPMRLIAFITHSADIRQILNHIGVESEPPAHQPGTRAAAVGGDGAAQPAPDYEVEQRVNW